MKKKVSGKKGGLLGEAIRAKKKRRTSVMDMVNAGMGRKKKKAPTTKKGPTFE